MCITYIAYLLSPLEYSFPVEENKKFWYSWDINRIFSNYYLKHPNDNLSQIDFEPHSHS